jgi:hypothetical protein
MGRICSTNGAKTNAYRVLVRKPEGRRPLGRPRLRWVDNIKVDFREMHKGWAIPVLAVQPLMIYCAYLREIGEMI